MQLAIGTGGLDSNFNKDYWKIFLRSIEKNYHIYSALNYKNVIQYFTKAHVENIKIKNVIFKIEINANPLKKILNIPKQINLILDKYKIESIDTLQICNNPNANKLNMYLLKRIFNEFKKKKIVNNFFLECFDPFSDNLNKLIRDDFFKGYILKLNCLQRSASKKFFENILISKKKIISISPLADGRSEELMGNFDNKLKINLDQIIKNNGLNDYNSLNIAFLKSIANMDLAIFETKKLDKLIDLEAKIQKINPLNIEDFLKILKLQDRYKFNIGF